MIVGRMNTRLTFQHTADNGYTWTDELTCFCYVNGVPKNEFYIANAGSTADIAVTISCRYQPELMEIDPMTWQAVETDNRKTVYELTHPPDDVENKQAEIIFRGRKRLA